MFGKTLKPVVFFVLILAMTSLACQALTGGSDPAPVQPQVPVQEQPQQPAEQPSEPQAPSQPPAASSDYVVFTDRNDLYQFEVPGDWSESDGVGEFYYYDRFESPDQNAFIENIVYDDGEVFPGGTNGKFALYLLHNLYSSTGKEGDIKISDDRIMPDKSERLTWTSRGGGYSGMSFFEVRNKTTFLMFTLWWNDSAEDQHADNINHAIESYIVP